MEQCTITGLEEVTENAPAEEEATSAAEGAEIAMDEEVHRLREELREARADFQAEMERISAEIKAATEKLQQQSEPTTGKHPVFKGVTPGRGATHPDVERDLSAQVAESLQIRRRKNL